MSDFNSNIEDEVNIPVGGAAPPGLHHSPALAEETVAGLAPRSGGRYVDGTLGEGGHALALLEASGPQGRVLGIDRDPRSLAAAAARLARFGSRFAPAHGSYADMETLARQFGFCPADGVLLDLGFSSRQVDAAGYGLSWQRDEPLDMRYDPAAPLTAAAVVNEYPEADLADVIYRYGEEPRSRAVARAIVRNRPINSTMELAAVVAQALGQRPGSRIHPATRVFQALRIAVNDELGHLERGLPAAVNILAPQGRLAVISYHSLEDRLVKQFLTREARGCVCPPGLPQCVCGRQPTLKLINRRVIRPQAAEVEANPRSRSARLRLAQRL